MRVFIAIIFFVLVYATRAQDSLSKQTSPTYVQMCEVKMNNGQIFTGEVKQENDSVMVLMLADLSEKKISKSQAEHFSYYLASSKAKFKKELIAEHIGGCFYGATRNAFLFMPKKFEINSSELFVYNYNYNITKNYSVGLMTSLVAAPTMAHVKAHYQLGNKVFLGVDLFAGISAPIKPVFVQGAALKFTIGDYAKHLTASVAMGNGNSQQQYAYGLGGSKLLASDVYLVGELWAAKSLNGAAATIGFRTATRPRISWLGGIGALVGDVAKTSLTKNFAPFPYFGFNFRP